MLAVWRWWCDEQQVWGASYTTGGATQGWADLNYSVFNSSHLKPSVPLGSSSTDKMLPSCGQSDAVALPSSSPRGLRLVRLWIRSEPFKDRSVRLWRLTWCCEKDTKRPGTFGWLVEQILFFSFLNLFFPLEGKKQQLLLNVTEVTRKKMRKWPSDSTPPCRPAAAEIRACVH